MKLNLTIENDRIVGYVITPLDRSKPIYEIDEIPLGFTSGKYGVVNGVITKLGYTNEKLLEIENIKKENLRVKRKPLLEAFDKWEKAVLRGREVDSIIIMNWYKSILDLDKDAINNIPSAISYYLYK